MNTFRFTIYSLVAAIMIMLSGCAQTDITQEMRMAVQATKQKQYAEAAKHAEICLNYDNTLTDAVILYNYCTFLSDTRENVRRQAIYNLAKLTRISPESYPAWLFYGWVLVENKQYTDAIEPLEKALELIPKNAPSLPSLRLLLGICYVNNNLQTKALGILQPLQAKQPYQTWPELYNCLGILAIQRQSYDTAVAFFKCGLNFDPRNDVLLQNLAVTHDLYRNDPASAKKEYVACLIQKNAAGDMDSCRKIQNRLRRISKK